MIRFLVRSASAVVVKMALTVIYSRLFEEPVLALGETYFISLETALQIEVNLPVE